MLGYAVTFFLLAIIAAVFGFGGMAGTLASIAQFLAVAFVVLFLASLVYGVITGKRLTPPL